jgi:glycosyltransferase involved in cell wall biosynthesis
MSQRVIPVCSPIGENKHIVDHGENGFHAESAEEWIEAIKKVYRNNSLREKMSERARKTVEEKYDLSTNVESLLSIFDDKNWLNTDI